MAYGDFTLKQIKEKFGVNNQVQKLFFHFPSFQPSDWLKKALEIASKLPNRSEKAKSETIVMPILLELRERNNDFFTVYSGENLNVEGEDGLNGECDFILAKDIHTYTISYPILQIVEAKKGDIDLGVAQCTAQMIGAKLYNQQNGTPVDIIYGCVTNGYDWLFLKLANDTIFLDNQIYYLGKLEELLGVFQTIIDYYKETLK